MARKLRIEPGSIGDKIFITAQALTFSLWCLGAFQVVLSIIRLCLGYSPFEYENNALELTSLFLSLVGIAFIAISEITIRTEYPLHNKSPKSCRILSWPFSRLAGRTSRRMK